MQNISATPSNGETISELELLRLENDQLRRRLGVKTDYIRKKTNELLEVMGTKHLRPEELDDETLVELDPLGIISGSIKHVLENLKETNWQLYTVNEEASAIFAAAEVGILVIDCGKRIKSCNNKLKEQFFPEQKKSSVIGQLCSSKVCRNEYENDGCICDLILEGRKIARKDNCEINGRTFNIVGAPVFNQSGDISDMVIVYNEITELKAAEEQLTRLNMDLESRIMERTRQLETVNRQLESFCYTVSHDLRAPLRHISGFSSILTLECSDSLNELGLDCVKRISSSSSRMEGLIDGLLSLSKVSQAEMNRVNIDLSRSAEKIITMFRDTDPGRSVKSIVAEGLWAFGDAMLLEMALQNLIGNAWKYSSHNPGAVVEFGKADFKGKEAFFIRDNGVGFDMKYSNKLFRVFERLHGIEFEGTGVGLATVHKIIARHGGEIWVESSVGSGTTFYFTLPDINLE